MVRVHPPAATQLQGTSAGTGVVSTLTVPGLPRLLPALESQEPRVLPAPLAVLSHPGLEGRRELPLCDWFCLFHVT